MAQFAGRAMIGIFLINAEPNTYVGSPTFQLSIQARWPNG